MANIFMGNGKIINHMGLMFLELEILSYLGSLLEGILLGKLLLFLKSLILWPF